MTKNSLVSQVSLDGGGKKMTSRKEMNHSFQMSEIKKEGDVNWDTNSIFSEENSICVKE